jgi:electron transfer flavoprotein alpha subunit
MSQVLVLIEHSGGELSGNTAELLAAAALLGEPAAVVVAEPGASADLAAGLAALGAATVYAAESAGAAAQRGSPKGAPP